MPVADGAPAIVLWDEATMIHEHTIAFADLPEYLSEYNPGHGDTDHHRPFRITVHDDTIVAIQEQFLP